MPVQPASSQPELLTIAEAAELLRTPVATLRYWRHRNIGPRSFRLGRRVLYRRDELHAWIATCHEMDALEQRLTRRSRTPNDSSLT